MARKKYTQREAQDMARRLDRYRDWVRNLGITYPSVHLCNIPDPGSDAVVAARTAKNLKAVVLAQEACGSINLYARAIPTELFD